MNHDFEEEIQRQTDAGVWFTCKRCGVMEILSVDGRVFDSEVGEFPTCESKIIHDVMES